MHPKITQIVLKSVHTSLISDENEGQCTDFGAFKLLQNNNDTYLHPQKLYNSLRTKQFWQQINSCNDLVSLRQKIRSQFRTLQ